MLHINTLIYTDNSVWRFKGFHGFYIVDDHCEPILLLELIAYAKTSNLPPIGSIQEIILTPEFLGGYRYFLEYPPGYGSFSAPLLKTWAFGVPGVAKL